MPKCAACKKPITSAKMLQDIKNKKKVYHFKCDPGKVTAETVTRKPLVRRRATRKAPAHSATMFKVGTVKTGKDGKKWVIKAFDRKGHTKKIKRWVRTTIITGHF